MRSDFAVFRPSSQQEWAELALRLNGGVPNHLLDALFDRLSGEGAAVSVLLERNYIDRDFSAAYAAFYASLFRPYRKHCSRAHFFASDVSDIMALQSPVERMERLDAQAGSYLGNIVLRPLTHAPVSSAHISIDALAGQPEEEIGVRSNFRFHVMGVELSVEAMPLTQQDTRIGACAQATIWMAGRHFHSQYGAPWFSMPDISALALSPADNIITRSLPAGSDFLTADNMIRALRTMGRHPVMYAPDTVAGNPVWQTVTPQQVVARYVDSGIPVILGMQDASGGVGHGVVAVGMVRDGAADLASMPARATTAEFCSHILVNDDQRGPYCRLPIRGGASADYPFCFETDIRYLIVAMPEKVFITAEVAELIAVDMAKRIASQRVQLAQQVQAIGDWDVAPDFYASVLADEVVARTYLTYGWKYKARALRNATPDRFTNELILSEFPRYVWVTELSDRTASASVDPCGRSIRGHICVDATGSRFWESVLVADLPGLSLFWHFDSERPATPVSLAIRADKDEGSYTAKIRGSIDYSMCAAPATTPGA